MDRFGDGILSAEAVKQELSENVLVALEGLLSAVDKLNDFKIERAYDDGFEAGVISQENGLGRE